jgi:ankyrin repeat protein
VVQYLIEVCACDPNQPQQGKRSFSGRTALHWAARKGHLSVVQYLVQECRVNVEAATIDGTTAFGWASWQGHGPIMEFLSATQQLEQDGCCCDIHRINAFGCNAVLWCAQGERGGDVDIMIWLLSKGCNMMQVNFNGHGVLHKAAQRGNDAVCMWFLETIITTRKDSKGVWDDDIQAVLPLLGPDTEGYCPSDLAGMEGHEELARTLVKWEMDWIATNRDSLLQRTFSLPAWLTMVPEGISMRPSSDKELFIWEPLGGVRRMKSVLANKWFKAL